MQGQSTQKNCSVYPKGVGGDKPAWVAFDRQVLRFHAYFQEAVHEKREEQYRIRRCTVYFYLEDDTIQVNESRVENSGIPQGTLIRRHRIPKPPPNDSSYYIVDDFNVGQQLVLHRRTFQLTDCDEFTRNFLRKLGVRVPPPLETPGDPYSVHRGELSAAMQPLRPYEKQDTLRQFLDFDRQVLRFYCHWDDTDSMFGDCRQLELHYFLADDTVELLEKVPLNSGRDAVPVFLRRARLPKEPKSLHQPGVATKRTVLNVFGPTGHGGRFILDSLKTGAVQTEHYHESDLTIGAVISVWGRRLLLCDCDEFTKEFYRTKYGIEKFEPVLVQQPATAPTQREMPPYNGFGSEEDSLASCLNLIPKPPRRDFAKFMEKDRRGLDSNVLRLVARMDTTRPIDMDRRFIIFYHLSDDTITIFEPPQRNSGIIGGKFLERGQIAKPKVREEDATVYYQAEDLCVGSRIQLNRHKFVLIDADEYALRYMEKHAEQFPHANIDLILAKLKGPAVSHISEVQRLFSEADPSSSGRIAFAQFRLLVQGLSHGLLNEHEVLTLGRHFGQHSYPRLTSLVQLIQDDLQQKNYTSFQALGAALRACDKEGVGYIQLDELRHVCHGSGLPLSDQLVDGAIMNCQTNHAEAVDYHQFQRLLNWKEHPLLKDMEPKVCLKGVLVCRLRKSVRQS